VIYYRRKDMEELLRIMSEVRPDIDFETETRLIDDEILDSLDIVAIVTDVNDEFDVEINVNDLLPENFNSAAALYELIRRLQYE
jgi:acyl carrier protein